MVSKAQGSRACSDVVMDAWPLLQGTAAATAAWLIARYVFDHPEPFFAPIAAFVALNTALGERGLNALRLLQGVIVGIAVGELTLLTLSGGYGSLAIAILAATVVARALSDARIAVAQAAVSAILVVGSPTPTPARRGWPTRSSGRASRSSSASSCSRRSLCGSFAEPRRRHWRGWRTG